MTDDDALRRALANPRDEERPYEALQVLRPAMQRARTRRRVVMTALATTILTAGTAGALAAIPDSRPTTMRTSTISDVSEPSTTVPNSQTSHLDPVVDSEEGSREPLEESTPTLRETTERSVDTPDPPTAAPATPPTSIGTTPPTSFATIPPPVRVPAQQPTTTTTQAPQAAPTTQTITSACGSVVVTIESGAIQVTSTQPQPGFAVSVSDDGPTSIELRFTASAGNCEIHAELRPSGLDVEVQNHDDSDR